MTTKTALLLGASGLTGSHLLELLLNDPYYTQVSIYVRKPLAIAHPKLEQMVTDYSTLTKAVPADDVFCCLGTTIRIAGTQAAFKEVDLHIPARIAALQKQSGSTGFFVISALGANVHSNIFYSRVKGEMEAAIGSLAFPCLYIFRPSFIMGNRTERRTGERMGIAFARLISPLLVGPLRKYRPIAALQIAKAMLYYAKNQKAGIHIMASDKI